jgi:hypothetical protein
MTQCGETVVPKSSDVTEAEFRAAMLSGLARADKRVKAKALAFAMDITTKQLGNITEKGGMPGPKRLWDALAADDTALDDIADLYGKRLVPKDAVCDVDNAALVMSSLLAAMIAAEQPDSPGGRLITHGELLSMEDLVRAVHAKTGTMLTQITDLRRPRAA